MTTMTVQPSAALAIRPGQEMWTDKQRAALSVLGIKNATSGDLAVFMHYCQKTGLDPFAKQIYMICRREKQGDQWVDKQTIQVGIDGFRVIRDRIEQRQGVTVEYEDTIWYDADGGEHEVWLWDTPPAAARVVVVKNGRRFPGVVRTAAYIARNKNGDPAGQWRTQPDHMIEKCAEAFALRRAFPNDLGGVYLEDEMPAAPAAPARQPAGRVTAAEITAGGQRQAQPARDPREDIHDAGVVPEPPGRPLSRATSGQAGIIHSAFRSLGFEDHERDERLNLTARLAGLDDLATTSDLTQDQALRVQKWLRKCADRAALVQLVTSGETPEGGGQDG